MCQGEHWGRGAEVVVPLTQVGTPIVSTQMSLETFFRGCCPKKFQQRIRKPFDEVGNLGDANTVLEHLLNEGFEDKPGLNDVGGDYGTALCAACANGKTEVVRALVRAGARLNDARQPFGAPLHVAVLMENKEMVKLLMNPNPKDADCYCE
ncbi:hypothetical protein B0H14DRAFT_2583612 [Mycena olivaceomarginata]|nr:hypothetical protein B0H14DRAFT_2583612 [Mycena olivaceomarginata]